MVKIRSAKRNRKAYVYASLALMVLLAIPFIVIQQQSQQNVQSEAAKIATIQQVSPTPLPEFSNEMLNNGSFENSKSPWGLNVTSPANAVFGLDASTHYEGVHSASIEIKRNSSESKSVQLYQSNLPLISGRTFTISFWAKSTVPRQIHYGIQQTANPNTIYHEQTASLTTSWKQYAYTFNSPLSDSNTFIFFDLAQTKGTVWIDSASVTVQ